MGGALSIQAEGGFLMVEYHKSSAAFSLTAQLMVRGNFRASSLLFAVWVRMDWAGNDFWYPSMRRPPNPSSPSVLSKNQKKAANPKINGFLNLAGGPEDTRSQTA
jgi:hypothetical protein